VTFQATTPTHPTGRLRRREKKRKRKQSRRWRAARRFAERTVDGTLRDSIKAYIQEEITNQICHVQRTERKWKKERNAVTRVTGGNTTACMGLASYKVHLSSLPLPLTNSRWCDPRAAAYLVSTRARKEGAHYWDPSAPRSRSSGRTGGGSWSPSIVLVSRGWQTSSRAAVHLAMWCFVVAGARAGMDASGRKGENDEGNRKALPHGWIATVENRSNKPCFYRWRGSIMKRQRGSGFI
jgi:hypothetical protein